MISVIIPAYNSAKYIEAAVASVLDQDPGMPLEVIVVDDGSVDGTGEILERLADGEPRLRLVRQENQGVSAARNAALAALRPETTLVTFLDSDDAFPVGRLRRDLALLNADPDLELVYGQLQMVEDRDVHPRKATRTEDQIVRGISATVGTFRRAVIEVNGMFDTSFTHGEDLDFLLRIFERDPKALLLPEVSVLYRQHPNGATADKQKLRRGVMRAMLLHARRRRENPALVSAESWSVFTPVSKDHPLPRYSAIIPAYNASRFLPDTIASVLSQTHPPSEVIIVDDGSTDDTAAVLALFGAAITVVRQENSGAGAATNAGIAASSMEYLAFLDADDLWRRDKISEQLTRLVQEENLGGIFCRSESFAEDGTNLSVDDSQSGWSRSTLVARRSVFVEVGPVADFGKRAGEMIDWIARAREAGFQFGMVEKPLAQRRLHAGSMTARADHLKHDYMAALRASIQRKRALRNGST